MGLETDKAARMVYQTDETRKQILVCAEKIFSEQGFFNAQMKDIAQAVGMSRNTLYRYYRDKQDLGLAILDSLMKQHSFSMIDQLRQLVNSKDLPATDRLKSFFLSVHSLALESSVGRFLAEFDSYFTNDRAPEGFVERVLTNELQEVLSLIESLFAQGQAEGSIRSDISAAQLTITMHTSVKTVQQAVQLRSEVIVGGSSEQVLEVPRQLIELLITGISVPQPPK